MIAHRSAMVTDGPTPIAVPANRGAQVAATPLAEGHGPTVGRAGRPCRAHARRAARRWDYHAACGPLRPVRSPLVPWNGRAVRREGPHAGGAVVERPTEHDADHTATIRCGGRAEQRVDRRADAVLVGAVEQAPAARAPAAGRAVRPSGDPPHRDCHRRGAARAAGRRARILDSRPGLSAAWYTTTHGGGQVGCQPRGHRTPRIHAAGRGADAAVRSAHARVRSAPTPRHAATSADTPRRAPWSV